MKKILILSLLVASLCVHAQTDTSEVYIDSVEVQMIALPDSTAIGAPDGKSVSKEIGPAGGKIVSEDGRVELNFPEGALSVNTTISIQPIVNLIPNGNGKAYQFEPSGIQFKKPVQIIFHYTDQEAETCPPELKFMALQDHRGKWEYMGYNDWDSANKSLKGSISHFSAFLDGNKMELSTVDTSLKVGKSFDLRLIIVAPPGDPGEDELPLLPPSNTSRPRQVRWSVPGGPRFGTIRREPAKYSAVYTAPNHLPGSDAEVVLKVNEVTVRDVVQRSTGAARRWIGTTLGVPTTFNLATFTCRVKLYDEYKITISAKGGFDLFCDAKISDESSFELRIFPNKRPEIGDPINAPPTLTKQASCGNDGDLNYDVTGCVGPVNIRKSLLMGYGLSYYPLEYTLEFSPIPVRIANAKGKFYGNKTRGSEDFMDIYINVGNKIKFKVDRVYKSYIAPEEDCDCEVTITITPI